MVERVNILREAAGSIPAISIYIYIYFLFFFLFCFVVFEVLISLLCYNLLRILFSVDLFLVVPINVSHFSLVLCLYFIFVHSLLKYYFIPTASVFLLFPELLSLLGFLSCCCCVVFVLIPLVLFALVLLSSSYLVGLVGSGFVRTSICVLVVVGTNKSRSNQTYEARRRYEYESNQN